MSSEDHTDAGFAASLGVLGCVAFLLLGILQIGAGYIGIADRFGDGWALAALIAAMMVRFSLPLTVGCFLCARDVWGWHWAPALVFAAPGLVFRETLINSAT